MPQSLDSLITQLDAILANFDRAEIEHQQVIESVADVHHEGARNLVHYTALRHHDLRELQSDLMDMGITSLASAEAHVAAKVHAARNLLTALRGDPGPWDLAGINRAIDSGDELLRANSAQIFGPVRPGRDTRIMVTLPSEASVDAELVASFVQAGMDIARVNCAHDDPGVWARMTANVAAAAAASGRRVQVSMDLPGPKLRTGPIAPGPAVGRARTTRAASGALLAPARLWVTPSNGPAEAPQPPAAGGHPALVVTVDPAWLAARRVGEAVTLTDARGLLRSFAVSEVSPTGVVAEGERNAYVADGTELRCAGTSVIAHGIPPLEQRLRLDVGDKLLLTTDLSPAALPAPGQTTRLGCTLPAAVAAMRPGDAVLLDDGAIAAKVELVSPGEALLQVTRTKPGGQWLGAEKGINLPDTVLPLTALTPSDDALLPFVAKHADMVAVSFLRTAADVDHLLSRLAGNGCDELGLVLKIETRQGFENLPSILLSAMRHRRLAVMIARGDLAVEMGFERLSEVPRQILALCEAAHVPAIWATQVLETLAKTGQPARAEITDAAAAQRAEAVMLNKGPHILDAIAVLDDILATMGQIQIKSRTLLRRVHAWDSQ